MDGIHNMAENEYEIRDSSESSLTFKRAEKNKQKNLCK